MASFAETFVTKSYDKKERKVKKAVKKGAEGPKRSVPKKKPTVGSRFAKAAQQAKPKRRLNTVSGTVAAAKKKGKKIGPAAPGTLQHNKVQDYAIPPKYRKKPPRMGAGVPGFTYGRDTI